MLSEYDTRAIKADAERAAKLQQIPALVCPYNHFDHADQHRLWTKSFYTERARMLLEKIE